MRVLDEHLSPLSCIPKQCNSLNVDEYFTPLVSHYVEQPANLQHLAVSYDEHPTCDGGNVLTLLPDLRHLTQLRSLRVKAPENCAHALANCLAKCPASLTSCYIGPFWYDLDITFLPEVYQPVLQHLGRLTKLHLGSCRVHIPEGSITCLKGLTNLSITGAEIDAELKGVTRLTGLVSLALSHTYAPGTILPCEGKVGGQPWGKFKAWPALSVFKFANCWLINESTALDIASVPELHTDRLRPGMEIANVHLEMSSLYHNTVWKFASLSSPVWCSCLVCVHVDFVRGQCCALHLAPIVQQVLEVCLCLESFYFNGEADDSHGQAGANIMLGNVSQHLKDLKLSKLCCSKVGLGPAVAVTSLGLIAMDWNGMSCELILPSTLERLESSCNCLFSMHGKHVLDGLSSLTHLTIETESRSYCEAEEAELHHSEYMPTLPSSLRRLHVMSSDIKKLLDDSAQRCLRFCTSLEHLTLPANEYPEGELHAWVKAAQHVHIVDNGPDWGRLQ